MKLFLIEWMRENYPIVLEIWEETAADFLLDLDIWLEEHCGWIDQEYQAYVEGEE